MGRPAACHCHCDKCEPLEHYPAVGVNVHLPGLDRFYSYEPVTERGDLHTESFDVEYRSNGLDEVSVTVTDVIENEINIKRVDIEYTVDESDYEFVMMFNPHLPSFNTETANATADLGYGRSQRLAFRYKETYENEHAASIDGFRLISEDQKPGSQFEPSTYYSDIFAAKFDGSQFPSYRPQHTGQFAVVGPCWQISNALAQSLAAWKTPPLPPETNDCARSPHEDPRCPGEFWSVGVLRQGCSAGTVGETLRYSYLLAEFAVQPFREDRIGTYRHPTGVVDSIGTPLTAQFGSYNMGPSTAGFRANRFWIRPSSTVTAIKDQHDPLTTGQTSLNKDFMPAATINCVNTSHVSFPGGTLPDTSYDVDACVAAAGNTGIFHGRSAVTVTQQNTYYTPVDGEIVEGLWECRAHHYLLVCCNPLRVRITGDDVCGAPGILDKVDAGGFWISEITYVTGPRAGEIVYEVNINAWHFQTPYAYAQDGFLSGDSMEYRANENSDEPSRPGHYVPVFTSSGSSLASYADVRIEVAR